MWNLAIHTGYYYIGDNGANPSNKDPSPYLSTAWNRSALTKSKRDHEHSLLWRKSGRAGDFHATPRDQWISLDQSRRRERWSRSHAYGQSFSAPSPSINSLDNTKTSLITALYTTPLTNDCINKALVDSGGHIRINGIHFQAPNDNVKSFKDYWSRSMRILSLRNWFNTSYMKSLLARPFLDVKARTP